MPSRIRGITFSLNLWSRRSDNITPLKEITLSCLRPATPDGKITAFPRNSVRSKIAPTTTAVIRSRTPPIKGLSHEVVYIPGQNQAGCRELCLAESPNSKPCRFEANLGSRRREQNTGIDQGVQWTCGEFLKLLNRGLVDRDGPTFAADVLASGVNAAEILRVCGEDQFRFAQRTLLASGCRNLVPPRMMYLHQMRNQRTNSNKHKDGAVLVKNLLRKR